MSFGTKFKYFSIISTIIFLFIVCSIKSVGPLQLGLRSNDMTANVDTSKTYASGLHWIGPMCSFIYFPSTQVTITFSDRAGVTADAPPVSTRTGEDKADPDSGGQPITISASLQYTFPNSDQLGKIYSSFGTAYQARYTLIARNTISNVAQTFAPEDFWTKRTLIADAMLAALQLELSKGGYITVSQLQLLRIDFPVQYESMITAIQLQVQERSLKEYQQRVIATLRNLDVMQTRVTAETGIISADATRKAKMVTNKATADGYILSQSAKANATRVVVEALGFTAEQTVQYLKLQAIKKHPSQNTVLGTGDIFTANA